MRPGWLVGAAVVVAGLVRRRRRGELPTVQLVLGALAVVGALLYGLGAFTLPDVETLLEDAGDTLGKWTYLLVGGLAFLETGAFVGLLAPGESAILVGGVVAGQGKIDLLALIALVWACAVAGDLVSFYLGRRLGRAFLERHGPKVAITEERLQQVEAFFQKYGGRAIFLGRFVGLVRAVAPFLAGSGGMPLRRFLPSDVLGAGLWGTTFCLLGYAFSRSVGKVFDYAKQGAFALGAVIAIVVGIVVAVRFLRVPANRRQARDWLEEQARRPLLRPVAAVLRPVATRLVRPARFAWARLTPGDLGLELTTLLAVLAVGLFALVGYAVALGQPGPIGADATVRGWAADVRTGGTVAVAKVLTSLGALWLVGPVVTLAAVGLVVKREVLEGLAILSGFWLASALVPLVKGAEERPRPGGGLVDAAGSSFPSGHAAHAVAWVALAVALARVVPALGARVSVVAIGIALAAVVAATRVLLRVHWLSDVLGGLGLGAACFAACGLVALLVGHARSAARSVTM